MRLEFHPAVQRDLTDALDYYRNEGGPHLSERFEKEFRACLTAIKAAPAQSALYLGSETLRRIRLSNFPYIIQYRERPEVLHDEDEGIAEALLRDAEFEVNPSMGVSLEELDQQVRRRRS